MRNERNGSMEANPKSEAKLRGSNRMVMVTGPSCACREVAVMVKVARVARSVRAVFFITVFRLSGQNHPVHIKQDVSGGVSGYIELGFFEK